MGTAIMKRILRVVSVVLMAVGAVWFLQGISVLPGSFMTGQTQWAVNGGIVAAAGLILWIVSKRRP